MISAWNILAGWHGIAGHSWGQMRRLAMVMVPLFFVVSLAKGQSTELEHDLIGMLLLMTGSLLQAWIIISMVKTSDELLGSKLLNFMILSGLVVVSLGQMALTASGYYYTALQMQHQLVGYAASGWADRDDPGADQA